MSHASQLSGIAAFPLVVATAVGTTRTSSLRGQKSALRQADLAHWCGRRQGHTQILKERKRWAGT